MKTLHALAVLFLPLLACHAADYQGADAVLKQVAASAGDPTQAPSPVRRWQDDLARYREHATSLPPDESARVWIDLFEHAARLPPSPEQRFDDSASTPLRLVLRALPPPAVWDALALQASARPAPDKGSADFTATGLRIIVATLQNQPPAVREALDAARAQANSLEGSQRTEFGQFEESLRETFLRLTEDGPGKLARFEATLARRRAGAAPAADDEEVRRSTLDVPDLVSLAGPARAETLLKEVFTLDLPAIEVNDERTLALARRVAVEAGDRLRFAPWSLTLSLDATALYELLERRFPQESGGDSTDRQQAAAYHVLGLIVAGRTDEAVQLAVTLGNRNRQQVDRALDTLPNEAVQRLAEQGYAKQVYRLLDRLLTDQPALPYWHNYIATAVLAGETDAMLAHVKVASERPDLKPRARENLCQSYGEAFLAVDHVVEALPILRDSAAARGQLAGKRDPAKASRDEQRQPAQARATLAGIVRRLGDNALLNEQLDALVALAAAQPDALDNVNVPGDDDLNETFLAAGRGPDRERLLAAAWAQGERTFKEAVAKESALRHARQRRNRLPADLDLPALADRPVLPGRPLRGHRDVARPGE